jgi:ACT domain-containing protein
VTETEPGGGSGSANEAGVDGEVERATAGDPGASDADGKVFVSGGERTGVTPRDAGPGRRGHDDDRGRGSRAMTDGGAGTQSYTVRLELADEPGELLRALEPIAAHGGNLLSVVHERGDRTPRGRIPVELDLECPPESFEELVAALRSNVEVARAGPETYDERLRVLLVGHLVDTDLSDTLATVEESPGASVVDVAVAAPEGTDGESSARVELAVASGAAGEALATLRAVADRKSLRLVEPLGGIA